MPKPRSRRQFAWLPVLLILLAASALIIGAIVLRYVEADLVARSGETLALAAVDIADKLDRVLFERYGDIQVLAETPVLQGSDPEAMAAYLTLVRRTNPAYVWIGVVDAAGRIVAATDPTSVGQDRSDRSWFQAVRDDLSVHVQDAQPSEDAGGVMAVGFTAPLRGKGEEFLGAVTTRVELQVLEDVFARTAYAIELQRGVSARIEWQFLNRDGDIILDSLLRQEMKVNLKRLGLPSAVLSLEGEPGYVQEEHLRRKVPVITGYAKTGGYGRFTDLQWGVLVRMDRSEVLAPIRAVLWKLGLAGAVLWGPLFGLLLWSVWRLRVEWAHARESEAAIREGENRFRSAFEETAIGMVLLEPNGRFLRVNRAFCAMVGYAEDELLTKTFQAITHPDDLDRNIKDVEKLLAGEIPFSRIEKRYLHKLGQTIWVHVNVSLVRDARGAPRYFIAQSQDITERKQAEEQLRQSEERFRKMFDDAPIGMATVGLDYRFIRVNKTLCNMLGYTDQELTGKTFADITYHEDIKEDIRLAEQVFKGEIPSYELEKRYVKKDGELVWIHLTATVLRNQAGEVLYGLAMIEDITERKQMDADLKFFKHVIDQTHEPVYWLSPEEGFRFVYVNAAACRHYGYPAEELLRMSIPDWDPNYPIEECKKFWQDLKTKKSRIFETQHRHSTGDIVPVEVTANYIAIGEKEYLAGTIRNITERKRAEERQAAQVAVSLVLAESATLNEAAERVLQAIGDTVGWELGLVWQVDREAAVLRCETLWQSSTLKADEFVALSRAMTFPSGIGLPGRVWASGEPAWIADVVKDPNFPRAPAAAKLGLHGAFGFPVKSRDKTLGVIEFFSREIRQPDNSLLAMMADIGLKIGAFVERMRAEETARASEERFRLAIDHAGDAVLYIDGTDAIVWANHQASVITGQPLETLVGKSLMAAFAAQPLAKAQLASIGLGKAVPPLVEFEVFLRDGTSKWLEVTITHVRKGEEVVGWLLVARDRTERRQIERQLRQSEKMAALGLLLDGVAHEINNPLFMISGFAQLADEKVKKGQYDTLAADLASIREAVDRSTEIIQRTLTVARRAKAGGEPCQVNNVVQQTLDLVAHGLADDKIALSKNFQTGLPPVLANPRELSQVFSNLIDNARRAMASAQRRGTLIVTTALVPNQPKPWVELRVIDDGPGVAPELQTRIFEPFSTAQQGSKGTGLSLAICHRIVTELGGTLTLESKVGQGATFIMRLPALEAMAP